MIKDQIAELEKLSDELRKACQEQTGVDPAFDHRAPVLAFTETRLPVLELNRIRDALSGAARALGQQQQHATERDGRIGRLESSNGALMVDRDRGIAEAGQRATYAWGVAEAALAAMCGVLRALDGRDGLTAAQVGKLRRAIDRANNKACGRG